MKNHIFISGLSFFAAAALSFSAGTAMAETRSPDDCVGALSDDSTFQGTKNEAVKLCENHSYDEVVCAMGLSIDKNFVAQLQANQILELTAGVYPAAFEACAKDSTILSKDVEALPAAEQK